MTRFLWGVTDNAYSMRPIAFFFEERDAAAFINSELGKRNLYECEPRYDRREGGYRPVGKPSGYAEWLESLALTETQSDPFLNAKRKAA